MATTLIARASTTIDAPTTKVWSALVSPEAIKQYMFGATVVTNWREGSPIAWKGEWEGQRYEDKGVVQRLDPDHLLQYSHFSPRSGAPDTPENYHTVTIELSEEGDRTRVVLTQDKNSSEQEREQSAQNWATMLAGLKKFVEHARRRS